MTRKPPATVALLLAATVAATLQRVLLIDADLQSPHAFGDRRGRRRCRPRSTSPSAAGQFVRRDPGSIAETNINLVPFVLPRGAAATGSIYRRRHQSAPSEQTRRYDAGGCRRDWRSTPTRASRFFGGIARPHPPGRKRRRFQPKRQPKRFIKSAGLAPAKGPRCGFDRRRNGVSAAI